MRALELFERHFQPFVVAIVEVEQKLRPSASILSRPVSRSLKVSRPLGSMPT
ncbi:MAG: hypothetical protein R3D69_07100 [Xanthobacteraceae bacterium]